MTCGQNPSIVQSIEFTSFPPRPPQWIDDSAAPVLEEEILPCRSVPVDAVSGAVLAVKGFRSACRDLLERAGL
ncbi:hypothetical protein ACH9EU_01850 [Kocuria sp. M1R5S2]|uniref:hypothetical protein n=1 Tax=Kocuria rhizosphaerae TaxID=3376285 RepID=UPI00379F90F7